MFDIQLPNIYPAVPPHFCYLSQCSGRLNPNLYDNGKVCVSLLGTWIGKVGQRWLAVRVGAGQSGQASGTQLISVHRVCVCVCCRGQRGGRGNPAFSRCLSPSKVGGVRLEGTITLAMAPLDLPSRGGGWASPEGLPLPSFRSNPGERTVLQRGRL